MRSKIRRVWAEDKSGWTSARNKHALIQDYFIGIKAPDNSSIVRFSLLLRRLLTWKLSRCSCYFLRSWVLTGKARGWRVQSLTNSFLKLPDVDCVRGIFNGSHVSAFQPSLRHSHTICNPKKTTMPTLSSSSSFNMSSGTSYYGETNTPRLRYSRASSRDRVLDSHKLNHFPDGYLRPAAMRSLVVIPDDYFKCPSNGKPTRCLKLNGTSSTSTSYASYAHQVKARGVPVRLAPEKRSLTVRDLKKGGRWTQTPRQLASPINVTLSNSNPRPNPQRLTQARLPSRNHLAVCNGMRNIHPRLLMPRPRPTSHLLLLILEASSSGTFRHGS